MASGLPQELHCSSLSICNIQTNEIPPTRLKVCPIAVYVCMDVWAYITRRNWSHKPTLIKLACQSISLSVFPKNSCWSAVYCIIPCDEFAHSCVCCDDVSKWRTSMSLARSTNAAVVVRHPICVCPTSFPFCWFPRCPSMEMQTFTHTRSECETSNLILKSHLSSNNFAFFNVVIVVRLVRALHKNLLMGLLLGVAKCKHSET